jgi:hypothetical protein
LILPRIQPSCRRANCCMVAFENSCLIAFDGFIIDTRNRARPEGSEERLDKDINKEGARAERHAQAQPRPQPPPAPHTADHVLRRPPSAQARPALHRICSMSLGPAGGAAWRGGRWCDSCCLSTVSPCPPLWYTRFVCLSRARRRRWVRGIRVRRRSRERPCKARAHACVGHGSWSAWVLPGRGGN